MTSKLPFNLPPIDKSDNFPIWDGKNFRVGDVHLPILEYSENLSGWSEDLTTLHEDASGKDHPIDIASRKMAVNSVKKYCSSYNQSILEIGCSSGYLLEDLKWEFKKSQIIGADVVRGPLLEIKKKIPDIPLFLFDILKCPIPDNSIDVIIMLNVLEHIEDDKLAIKKAFNMLKPNGIFIIEVPASPYLYDSYDKELMHFRRYSTSELKTKVKNSGFIINNITHLGFLIFPLFAVVKIYNKLFKSGKSVVVKNNVKKTSDSFVLRFVFYIENFLFDSIKICGIRLNLVARKPKNN
tara:strand:+ start:1075 stop:1959 length:885 start_codon:yes stop_codon:yes gene_type:complete